MSQSVKVEDVGGALPSVWSASALDALLTCPLRFWFARVAGWREPETVEMVVGTVVHGVLEDLYSRPPQDRDFRVVRDLLPARVTRHVSEGSGLDPSNVQAQAREKLLAYVRVEPEPSGVEVAPGGLEREVRTDLGEAPFRGFIDRVTESGGLRRVSDYKTGGSKAAFLPGKWRQQLLYAAALEALGEPVDEVALVFLGDGPRVTVRPVYPLAVQRAVSALADGKAQAEQHLDSREWPAVESGLCNRCGPFKVVCPVKARKAPVPGSEASDARLRDRGLTRRKSHAVATSSDELREQTVLELGEEQP